MNSNKPTIYNHFEIVSVGEIATALLKAKGGVVSMALAAAGVSCCTCFMFYVCVSVYLGPLIGSC